MVSLFGDRGANPMCRAGRTIIMHGWVNDRTFRQSVPYTIAPIRVSVGAAESVAVL